MIRSAAVNDYYRPGSVAERSKALVSGTSLLGGVGSNPATATLVLKKENQEKQKERKMETKRNKKSKAIKKYLIQQTVMEADDSRLVFSYVHTKKLTKKRKENEGVVEFLHMTKTCFVLQSPYEAHLPMP